MGEGREGGKGGRRFIGLGMSCLFFGLMCRKANVTRKQESIDRLVSPGEAAQLEGDPLPITVDSLAPAPSDVRVEGNAINSECGGGVFWGVFFWGAAGYGVGVVCF